MFLIFPVSLQSEKSTRYYLLFVYIQFFGRFLLLSFRFFKGTVSRDFLLLVLYMNQFPSSPIIPLRPFRIFSKIRGDIRSSRFATGVNDTGGKWKKSSIRKIIIIFFGHLWVVEETYI